MPQTRQELAPKLLGESPNVKFDFAGRIAAGVTLSSPTVTATVYSGTDAAPSNIISGAASVSGSIVTQKVTGGTLGVIYELLCQVTTSDSQTLQMVGLLAVIPDEV